MAKYRNIISGEVVVKLNKATALEYFKVKDKDVTLFHIKSVIIPGESDLDSIAAQVQILNTNKGKEVEDGKRE